MARALDVAYVKVKADSKIVINQVKGKYMAKSKRLRLYLKRVWEEQNRFQRFTIERISQKEN